MFMVSIDTLNFMLKCRPILIFPNHFTISIIKTLPQRWRNVPAHLKLHADRSSAPPRELHPRGAPAGGGQVLRASRWLASHHHWVPCQNRHLVTMVTGGSHLIIIEYLAGILSPWSPFLLPFLRTCVISGGAAHIGSHQDQPHHKWGFEPSPPKPCSPQDLKERPGENFKIQRTCMHILIFVLILFSFLGKYLFWIPLSGRDLGGGCCEHRPWDGGEDHDLWVEGHLGGVVPGDRLHLAGRQAHPGLELLQQICDQVRT